MFFIVATITIDIEGAVVSLAATAITSGRESRDLLSHRVVM